MAIQNDFRIYPKSKVIRHLSTGTTVYTAVEFYSYLMNTFDEPGYLTYQTPIRFNTPTSFTMTNGWFLDNGDGSDILQFLYGGGIDTSGYATITDPVLMLDMDGPTTDFIAGDLDKDIEDDGAANDVGPLLSYKNDYPTAGRARIWIRDTNTHGAIADNSVMTTEGGTGAGNAAGGSASGDDIYLNLFTIASFPSDVQPQVYVYQKHPVTAESYSARVRITEWSAFDNWDRGTIDILFPIKLAGTFIDIGPSSGGRFKTFVRQSGDSYTFVESEITASGRNPIATETSSDEVNITKGEHYLLYDASDAGSFSVDDVIQSNSTGASTPPTFYAEVVAVDEFAVTSTGLLTLRGLRGVIADGNALWVGTTQEATANGSPGDTYLSYTGTDPTTVPQVMTGAPSGAKRILRGVDAAENVAILQDDPTGVTGTNRDAYYKDFVITTDTVTGATDGSVTPAATSTTLISGYNDITVSHINGTIPTGVFSGGTGTYTLGERVTWNAGASSAIVVDYVLNTTLTLANVDPDDEPVSTDVIVGDLSATSATASAGLTDTNIENYAFTLQSAFNYSVFIEGGSIYNTGRSLSDIYAYLQYYLRDGQGSAQRIIYTSDAATITELAAEEYIKADTDYSATKTAPFGTLAGTTFFGAQGVWLQGMRSADNNNIKFIDTGGTLRFPDPSIDLVISNTRVGDRIAVYLESGTTTLPNKAQYVSHATLNAASDSTFDRVDAGGAFPIDTPASGTFIAVAVDENEEHRYRYASYNATGGAGTDGQLVLPAEISGTAAAGSDGQTLNATAAVFGSSQIGDIIKRTNNEGGWAYITSITDTDTVVTTLFSAGITAGWDETATADTFESLSLVQTYDASDTFFIPYMDFREAEGTEGTPGSQTVTVLYSVNREVVIEARNVDVDSVTQIIPFKTTGTITSSGLSQSVIRNEDTVFA